jgi:hypothetical protein
MLYRAPIAVAILAVAACSAQNTRPPAEEPTSTTSVTGAALTSRTTSTTITTTPPAPEEALPGATAPLARKFREVLRDNPALEGVSLEHLQVDQVNGHVILRGRLPTVADKVEVEMSVRRMKGVTSVRNDIRPVR